MELLNNINITNEDNMVLMARYPDNYFDLAIVDPEYGIGASKPSTKNSKIKQNNGEYINVKQTKYTHKNWDNNSAPKEYFKELFRVSKNQIIWGANYYDFNLKGGRIVWDKLNGDSDQFGCEIAYCSLNERTDIVYFLWAGMMQGIYVGKDVKEALIQQGNKKLNETRIHPTQKPVALCKYLLKNFAQQGDKILDTHSGSASLAIACHDYGYELTACEKDKEYYKDSIDRVRKHQQQTYLVFPE